MNKRYYTSATPIKRKRKKKKKKLSTTKILIIFLFVNCVIIELFTAWALMKSLEISALTGVMTDFSPLNALIGAVVGEVVGFGIYAAKSAKENSKGGITYDAAMEELKYNNGDAVG